MYGRTERRSSPLVLCRPIGATIRRDQSWYFASCVSYSRRPNLPRPKLVSGPRRQIPRFGRRPLLKLARLRHPLTLGSIIGIARNTDGHLRKKRPVRRLREGNCGPSQQSTGRCTFYETQHDGLKERAPHADVSNIVRSAILRTDAPFDAHCRCRLSSLAARTSFRLLRWWKVRSEGRGLL